MKKNLHGIHDYFEKSFFQRLFFFGLSGTTNESALNDFQNDADLVALSTRECQPIGGRVLNIILKWFLN